VLVSAATRAESIHPNGYGFLTRPGYSAEEVRMMLGDNIAAMQTKTWVTP
jgi:hypothetical protein